MRVRLSGFAAADDDDGAGGMVGEVLSGGAEQGFGESAVPTVPHNQQRGAVGFVQQHAGRVARATRVRISTR